ncbi:MAG: dUTPase [Firmicutes bacterium]|nr:dUTPase [Bacillota bacterium]
MDRLEHIFQLQRKFDDELIHNRGLDYDLSTWLQKETLAIVAELAELLNEVNFKWWKNPQPVDRERVKEELVDILHFFVSMCLKCDISPEELYQGYLTKNQENFRRQHGTSLRRGYEAPARD